MKKCRKKVLTFEPVLGIGGFIVFGSDEYYCDEDLQFHNHVELLIALPFVLITFRLWKL
jgi:hypothetical protein